MITRLCKRCQQKLPATDDFFYRIGEDRHFAYNCKKCHNLKTTEYRRKRKEEGRETKADKERYKNKYLEEIRTLKLNKGCCDCGYKEHAEALDFDHMPSTKKRFNLSQARYKSWATIEKEIEKCEVVCANCHRVRTRKRKAIKSTHF